MLIQPENSSVSIVLVGSFNAVIFNPDWFFANGLLNKTDLEKAEVEVVHRNATVFKVGERLRIIVEPARFIAETSEPPFINLCDLVFKTFKEVLTHTPISQLGINRQVHFSVGDETIRDKIGKKLAPQDAWGEWARSIQGRTAEKRGGLISLTMAQKDLEDRESGRIQAQVGPSPLVKDGTGIFMVVNDHYEIPSKTSVAGATEIMDLLVKQFDKSIRKSEMIIDQIMALKDKV